MKAISTYILEKITHLKKSESGIIVFDIDDTLLRANSNIVKIYKKDPVTGKEIGLTTDEFAKDPDAREHKDWFDYRDFDDEEKVYRSIIEGTPIVANLKILDAYIKAGYHFCFLTARGCEDAVKNALKEFIRYKDDSGQLKKLGDKFKEHLSSAINDIEKNYPGDTDAEKKANVLKSLCTKYDKVIFVDDDQKNLKGAKDLHLPNLKIIKAQK